ncbi:MAG TPA: glycosyltransferase family 4 protein [Phycisphaerae bacterium]|nr:glycosyltransferase family 4 protein [Phycisphaerae bacterium]HPP28234.1 glycosyltransferase family 4 protein [Phycisphaerae bacterium]HPU27068.1 glycosyltransferase family 4 protein [Phycisphaerae bacterium]HPZ97230.1 glycosyltransferase family 4 protein [Phycisphaerae bacterium]HQE29499.1 glycosyltransferase family 4 protein [Phycisphaerae bacterium]
MDVALIIERFESWRGGAETSTLQFANHLAHLGCRVTVLTTSQMPSTPELTVVPLPASRAFRSARTARFSRRAAEYVQSHRFDVVHCITPCLAADVYQPRGGTIPETLERNAAIRTSPTRRRLKQLGQQLNLKNRMLARLESQLLARKPAPWVVAISDYVRDQLERHYHFDPARIVKVFNGVDPDESDEAQRLADRTQIRRHYGIAYDELVVLCVAHNFKLKGVNKLIEALARPGGQAYRAVIVGRDNPAPYAQLAEQLGVQHRIIFTGPTQRTAAFFHAADVLAHPTYYDPCSRVVLEAMAAGLPAITTRFNGAAERITDGLNGYVIDSPEQVDQLADRLGRLADPDHRLNCGQEAPLAVSDCSMEDHARRVMGLYEQIVADRGERRALESPLRG